MAAPSSMDISRTLLIIAITALLFILGFIVVYLRNHSKKFTPLGWIESPRQIYQILRNAVRHRSTFELQFPHRGAQRRPILRCSANDITTTLLTLDASGVKNAARNWTGRVVNCYFKINLNGQHIYYAFSTRIANVEITASGRSELAMPLPERLENRQKRAFLRIAPPPEYMLGSALWLGRSLPRLEDMPYMGKWAKPALVSLPGKMQQFCVSDISAGGCRLLIPRKEMLDLGLEFTIAQHMVLLVDLLNPEGHERLRFWLHCRVQNIAAQYDTRSVETGVQFLAWAAPGARNTAELEWFALDGSYEVDLLGNWIIRRHLELFRDNSEVDDLYAT